MTSRSPVTDSLSRQSNQSATPSTSNHLFPAIILPSSREPTQSSSPSQTQNDDDGISDTIDASNLNVEYSCSSYVNKLAAEELKTATHLGLLLTMFSGLNPETEESISKRLQKIIKSRKVSNFNHNCYCRYVFSSCTHEL